MFRTVSGYKAQYHSLTLLVTSDFDEWRVLLQGPGIWIQGGRQFSEAKAKEHACVAAADYFHEKQQDLAPPAEVAWQPFSAGEFLSWRP